ncbi:MAG: hypothetical protein KGS44_16190, partial [Alphaproteobacteria bacterium]|nr:hypothetical protein [Alphaproteobacteria bacterium]
WAWVCCGLGSVVGLGLLWAWVCCGLGSVVGLGLLWAWVCCGLALAASAPVSMVWRPHAFSGLCRLQAAAGQAGFAVLDQAGAAIGGPRTLRCHPPRAQHRGTDAQDLWG